jgi:lactate dehydrogenase-like 2-hydroxyacid dehydrogenase
MNKKDFDVLLVGNKKPTIVNGLNRSVELHIMKDLPNLDSFIEVAGKEIRGIAVSYTSNNVGGDLMAKFPNLEIVSTFGVGYDHIDANCAAAHGIIVTNTPDVLNEEVADTAIGLLLNTVREFPQAERYLRSGKWPEAAYRLSPATLRDRTVGIVGMGRIGQAIAKRLQAFGVPVVYHSRNPQSGVSFKHYPSLLDMARDVDTLIAIVPGGAATKNLINMEVLESLGPNGIVINMARGSVVDESALIEALNKKTILSAGLDVYVNEPQVSPELIAMDNVVLFPHLGSASAYTRTAMDQLVVNNLLSWADGKGPLTPVAETPWPPKRR